MVARQLWQRVVRCGTQVCLLRMLGFGNLLVAISSHRPCEAREITGYQVKRLLFGKSFLFNRHPKYFVFQQGVLIAKNGIYPS